MDRAERRARRERKIARTKKWLERHNATRRDEDLSLDAKRLCDNPKFCKHWWCKNRREVEGPTIRERRQHASADAKLETWEDEL